MAYVYTMFDTSTDGGDIITDVEEIQTAPIWSGNEGTLSRFYTGSSTGQTSGSTSWQHQLYIFNENPEASSSAAVQFSIAYGHYAGSGSLDYDNTSKPGASPSRAVYGQYANLLLPDGTDLFTIGSGSTDDIIAININRARFKEQLDPGNWQLNLDANGVLDMDALHLIDSSDSAVSSINEAGRIYDVVSGSITNGPLGTSDDMIYGKVYVDQGIIVLHPGRISDRTTYSNGVGANTIEDNNISFLNALTGSANLATPKFTARNKEVVKSTHYFVRVKNNAYNYTDNPTFVTGSDSTLRYADMKTNPSVYITTIGLYDNADNCLAIAKLSKPLLKTFAREALIKVKLEY